MAEARRSGRPVSLGTRVAAVLAAPLAPLFGVVVADLVDHPPPPRRQRAPAASGLHPTQLWSTGPSAQAQLLHRAGYPVVLFDSGNHGASLRDHRLTRLSHRFNDDLVAVVDHARAMPQHAHARIAVWGLWFWTFPVLGTLARLDGAVHAVSCDSGPTSDLWVIVNSLPHAGLLPVPQALRAAPARTRWQAGYRRLAMAVLDPPADWPPVAQQGGGATPMLVVVGGRDAVTPVTQVRAVARRSPRAEVLVVPGAGHLQAIKVDNDADAATVLDLLARALSMPVAVAQHQAGGP